MSLDYTWWNINVRKLACPRIGLQWELVYIVLKDELCQMSIENTDVSLQQSRVQQAATFVTEASRITDFIDFDFWVRNW